MKKAIILCLTLASMHCMRASMFKIALGASMVPVAIATNALYFTSTKLSFMAARQLRDLEKRIQKTADQEYADSLRETVARVRRDKKYYDFARDMSSKAIYAEAAMVIPALMYIN